MNTCTRGRICGDGSRQVTFAGINEIRKIAKVDRSGNVVCVDVQGCIMEPNGRFIENRNIAVNPLDQTEVPKGCVSGVDRFGNPLFGTLVIFSCGGREIRRQCIPFAGPNDEDNQGLIANTQRI